MRGKCNFSAWLLHLFLAAGTPAVICTASGTEARHPTAGSSSSSILGVQTTTCPFRTANYITHGLPQQCLRTSRIVATTAGGNSGNATVLADGGRVGDQVVPSGQESPSLNTDVVDIATTTSIDFVSKFERPAASPAFAEPIPPTEDVETPMDTASFLSFEEWKAQNLAKAGQSAENFGERSPKEARRRPGSMASALDALGEDAEIDLNFGSEGGEDLRDGEINILNEAKPLETVEPAKHIRSKDAGKTCKERFNFASFDCAATVHKTNPESKGASAILVENKDSYMLNKCGAKSKFVIVELCDDILVDTIVLANYEFFSSMFRTFKVSVSDRYPVKSAGWRDLGVFEAKNSREIQAFLVENPLIWTRYLRIEFLTHYGKEFYCPISLLRIHGTTMMEEFRHQEELARGYTEDDSEEVEAEAVAEVIEEAIKDDQSSREAEAVSSKSSAEEAEKHSRDMAAAKATPVTAPEFIGPALAEPTDSWLGGDTGASQPHPALSSGEKETDTRSSPSTEQSGSITAQTSKDEKRPISTDTDHTITSTPSSENASSKSTSKASKQNQNDGSSAPHSRETTTIRNSTAETRSPSSVSSAAPTPTTQESFFKTIHKRLQLLEANATLSLQYIEEQSRLMRDTFSKMEKRQFNKSAAYLDHLNATVIKELRGFREQYDQLWQSTVIALDTQRELSEREILAISTRLTMLADEIVFQKRMTIAQSFLLIVVVGLVIFSKSPPVDAGFVRTVLPSRSHLRLGLESPPTSPSPPRVRPKSGRGASHKKRLREYTHKRQDSSDMELPTLAGIRRTPIPTQLYDDPANISTENISDIPLDDNFASPPLVPQGVQSSPATPSGLNSMKDRTWTSDGEYVAPDTAIAAGLRWRATSPLSNQVLRDEGSDEVTDDTEEDIPDIDGRSPESTHEATIRRSPFLGSPDDDRVVDSYFLSQ